MVAANTDALIESKLSTVRRMYSSFLPKILLSAQDFLERSDIPFGLTRFKVTAQSAETCVYPEL